MSHSRRFRRYQQAGRCDAVGKLGYHSWENAKAVKQSMEAEDGDREFELSIYRCRDCGMLHIGNDRMKPRTKGRRDR